MEKYKKYFLVKIKEYYPGTSDRFISEIDSIFLNLQKDIQFSKTSKNPMDRRMEIAGYFLAMIRLLDQQGESYDKIREICLSIAMDYVRPKNGLQKFLKRLPIMLINTWIANLILRNLDKRLSIKGHPDGFLTRIITDKKETHGLGYGIDILECGICKLFEKNNYKKYSPILCEIDYITSGMAGLTLVRSGTIANGAVKCDFRFKINTK